jgi:hypothetical protein
MCGGNLCSICRAAVVAPPAALDRNAVGRDDLAAAGFHRGRKRGRKMKRTLVRLVVVVAAAVLVSAISATSASADYGKGGDLPD